MKLNFILTSIFCVQFAEKFAEYKEAARLAKEKSQEKMEMATSPSQVCLWTNSSTFSQHKHNLESAWAGLQVDHIITYSWFY